jgi:hypothetical protein
MMSRNKPAPTVAERAHIERVKSTACVICDAPPPSECHEIEQGQWFTSVALCEDCHRGKRNGLHGERAMWRVTKHTELSALNETLRRVLA